MIKFTMKNPNYLPWSLKVYKTHAAKISSISVLTTDRNTDIQEANAL